MVEEQPLPASLTTIHHGYDDPSLGTVPSPESHDPIFQHSFPWSPPSVEQETYVIQIPKDQIFSIPPPDNAIIAERYRNPEKREGLHRRRCSCAIITLIVVAVVVGIILCAINILFHPQVPSFSIDHVSIKNSPSSTHNKTYIIIKLKAKNRNSNIENSYGSDGIAILLYKGHKIGKGNFPEFDQDADCSRKFQLGLTSSNIGALPHDIQSSIGDKKGKRHVALVLKMKSVPVKMKLWSKVINVVCNFKVTSLGAAAQNVISQQCQSSFK